jgi:GNAT superfamily N-acetyltransferase
MTDVVIRPAERRDCAAMHQLIVDLATYERAPQEVHSSAADLAHALFTDRPAVFAHVAEDNGEVVGMALWFLNYSTWLGRHGIYLEDLYVRPSHRKAGIGRRFLVTLAQLAVERGYRRLEWACLDWNEPAIRFYESLGAKALDEWTVHRLTGEALVTLSKVKEA